jgi:hypothetical protein
VATIAIAAIYLIGVFIVFATLGAIFRTGAYIYATTGKAPSSMDPQLLQASFSKKIESLRAGLNPAHPFGF